MRILALVILFLAPPLSAATPYERMLETHRQVQQYLERQARRLTDQAAEEIASKGAWEPLREKRQREMRTMLGLDPEPARTPLNVQITGEIDRGDFTIEKIAFESLPQVYVTANLYIPKQPAGPRPTIIYVCGHSYNPHGAKVQYQRHPISYARHGYVTMILDPVQIAETFALHHGILNNEMYDWYARGYTPAGLEVWNVIRALDYLETRPEADRTRFGITGRSGGAAMSWFSAAVDERLKAIVPVMGISTYAANVADNTQARHCDCMFAINSHLHDMMHQGALIAPRPLYMMHGREDRLFPVPGYEEFERTVGKLYESYGRAEAFRNLVVDTGHEDSDLLRGEALRWFDQWLAGIPARETDLDYEDLPGEQLAVFAGKPPAGARNYRVHEFFTPAPAPQHYATLSEWDARKAELLERLRGGVFRAFPADPAPVELSAGTIEAPDGFEALQFSSEEGITLQALYRSPKEGGGPALLYIASDGEDWPAIRDVLRQVISSPANPLMILYPRGVSETPWPKKLWKDTLRNAMHTGRTVDSMRLWDVLRGMEALRAKAGSAEIATLGIGVSGILGLYAAVFDESVEQTILVDAPESHRDGPIFLNVLRHTSLPEAAALIAPRRLTFYGRAPQAYQWTQGIFALHGKPHHFRLTMSVEGALNGRHAHDFPSGL